MISLSPIQFVRAHRVRYYFQSFTEEPFWIRCRAITPRLLQLAEGLVRPLPKVLVVFSRFRRCSDTLRNALRRAVTATFVVGLIEIIAE